MWRYQEPKIEDYESEEAYEEALVAYENALELYQEMYEEAYREY